jgi:hypothetical protein
LRKYGLSGRGTTDTAPAAGNRAAKAPEA